MITTHNKMLDELLEAVSTPTDLVALCTNVPYVKFYMEITVNDNFLTFDLPEAKTNDYHRSMAGALLLSRGSSQLVDVMFDSKASVNIKRKQYTALMSMLYAGEAEILKRVVTKDLSSIYENLTHEFICSALDMINGNQV